MNRSGNLYIFVYASVMVIAVAALLAIASTVLKPYQRLNVETEKRLDILKSIGRAQEVASASSKNKYVGDEYSKYIVEELVLNSRGEQVEGLDAFQLNVKDELSKPLEKRSLSLFVAQLNDSTRKYIVPLYGRGLWGPIWGYISLSDDFNTVYGAAFAHKSETPGLGAEISTPPFMEQFKGKQIFDKNTFVSVRVVKGGAKKDDPHGVDAVSGGTITSNGLETMLKDCLGSYQNFFEKNKKK